MSLGRRSQIDWSSTLLNGQRTGQRRAALAVILDIRKKHIAARPLQRVLFSLILSIVMPGGPAEPGRPHGQNAGDFKSDQGVGLVSHAITLVVFQRVSASRSP